MAADAERLAEAVARSMLADDDASRGLGMVLEEIAPGRARMRMLVREDMINSHELCHGGLIFALADSASAFAGNAQNRLTVVAAAEIHFVSPARKGETLRAEARERAQGGRSDVYDVEVTEVESGRLVALVRVRSHRVEGRIVAEEPP
jgi:acyl-CoA thioesterase